MPQKATISQALLAQYHRFAECERKVKEKRLVLRDKLIRMLQSGARIQQGQFDVAFGESEAHVLSRKTVVATFGESGYQWLREQVAPLSRVTLRVIDSKKNAQNTKAD